MNAQNPSDRRDEAATGTRLVRALQASGLLVAGGAIVVGASAWAQSSSSSVEDALAQRLPKTEVTAVDCEKIDGLCEVQAKQNLFYIDNSARYLIIGRVYDMETKQDLTAARLLDMNPDMLIGAAGAAKREGAAAPTPRTGRSPEGRVDPAKLAALPANGAIEMGRGRHTVTVFSDFRCGYCKRLYDTLETLDVKVVERPISVLGTRALSESVICAADQRKAVQEAYGRGAITTQADCDTSGLDANEAFARAHGFSGTPVIVREDGAVVHGFRPRDFLETWIKGRS